MTTAVVIPWESISGGSSNNRNTRKGGRGHGWGYKQAREAIHLHALDQVRGDRPRHPDGNLYAVLDFFPPDFRRRDVHNYAKVLLDGIQKVVYDDDYQIVDLSICRNDPDAEEPRVEITVTERP